jgi:hypothetical protein
MITFIATAWKETVDSYQFISSLLLQKDERWKCIIYCDEKNEFIENTLKLFNNDKFKLIYNDEKKGFWGHYNRKECLNIVDTEFVIQTSIQDYYTPNTVGELLGNIQTSDLILFNCIHNHMGFNILDSKPIRNHIDWGSFVIRTEIAKKVGINNPESSICDGLFIEDCLKYPEIRVRKLNKILTVHN